MKSKASDWNCSDGDTLAGRLLAHLNSQVREGGQLNLAPGGLEVVRDGHAMDYLSSFQQAILQWLLANTSPVARVDDPYAQTGIAYVVIAIDPCSPVIREVAEGTPDSYSTLVDAKEAARQVLQSTLEKASNSLTDLRQVGIDRIGYISL